MMHPMGDTYIRVETPGKEVRARRILLGLSLREAAARLGCSFQWLSRIERGESLPDIPLAGRLRTVLEVNAGLDEWHGSAIGQLGQQLVNQHANLNESSASSGERGVA